MKRKPLFLFFILLCLISLALSGCSFGIPSQKYQENILSSSPENASLTTYRKVINVVIFICFKDENKQTFASSLTSEVTELFDGDACSVKDYYSRLSYGLLDLESIFPQNNSLYYVYQDSHNRSYYENNSNKKGSGRTGPESKLLNTAITECDGYFNYSGINLDVDDDGYVDNVTFFVSGNYINDDAHWGKIMWPHSWQLDDITKEYDSSERSATLNNLNVNNYTFLFSQSQGNLGLLCHEFGHSIGSLPDLYHYSRDTDYLPVGYWDLMHYNCDVPQFTTTYMRWKYLGYASDSQIKELTRSGQYTLTPTSTTSQENILAYTVSISEYESIWIEYRRNDVSVYDGELPGNGIIVYRINTKATLGNQEARHNSVLYPDELYIYRPSVSTTGSTTTKEKNNLKYAFVSNTNPYFTQLGSTSITSRYHSSCIYLTDGKNTGIVIDIEEESAESVTFNIYLGDYDAGEITSCYIQGKDTSEKNKVELYYGDELRFDVFVRYNTKNFDTKINDYEIEYEYKICEEGQTAFVVFSDDYGNEHKIPFTLYIYDRPQSESVKVISFPKTTYRLGEEFSLEGLRIEVSYISGAKNTIYYQSTNSDKWSYVGFNGNICGKYTVTVTYADSLSVYIPVTVRSKIVSIEIDETDTCHLFSDDFTPSFSVIGTFSDGTKERLEPTEYLSSEDTPLWYEKNTVTIRLKEDSDITCQTYQFDIPSGVKVSEFILLTNPKQMYNYGEALDLSQGEVQIVFDDGFSLDGNNTLPLNNFYSVLSDTYQPNRSGKQTVSYEVDNTRLHFIVTVLPQANDLLSCTDESIVINTTQKTILLKRDITLSEFLTVVQSYLTISVEYDSVFTLSENSYGFSLLHKRHYVSIRNSNDTIIEKYAVYRIGDCNEDGTIDENDIPVWEEKILTGDTTAKYLDINGDGVYTLCDFSMLIAYYYREAE